jgi:hypothetical protein
MAEDNRLDPGLDDRIEWILANQAQQTRLLQEILKMSETFAGNQAKTDTNVAALTAAVASIGADITNGLAANATAIAALQAQVAAGTPVTAAQLADMDTDNSAIAAATTSLTTAASQLQAALNPTPPAGP